MISKIIFSGKYFTMSHFDQGKFLAVMQFTILNFFFESRSLDIAKSVFLSSAYALAPTICIVHLIFTM